MIQSSITSLRPMSNNANIKQGQYNHTGYSLSIATSDTEQVISVCDGNGVFSWHYSLDGVFSHISFQTIEKRSRKNAEFPKGKENKDLS